RGGTCPTARSPSPSACSYPDRRRRARAAAEQNLRLHDVSARVGGAPHGADVDQVLERVHPGAMPVQAAALLIDVEAVAEIDDAVAKSDAPGVRRERAGMQHVVAVDPGEEQTRAALDPAVDGG